MNIYIWLKLCVICLWYCNNHQNRFRFYTSHKICPRFETARIMLLHYASPLANIWCPFDCVSSSLRFRTCMPSKQSNLYFTLYHHIQLMPWGNILELILLTIVQRSFIDPLHDYVSYDRSIRQAIKLACRSPVERYVIRGPIRTPWLCQELKQCRTICLAIGVSIIL